MGSHGTPRWADLPIELLQHTFGFLSNKHRLVGLGVASSQAGDATGQSINPSQKGTP
jgi:hypothetical protein